MNLTDRHDTYIGDKHYWIRYHNGTYEVRHATPDWEEDNETVFRGHYEDCIKYIDKLYINHLENTLF